jgi:hypothetical protein
MKRAFVGAVAAGAALVGLGAPALAAPPGLESRFEELEFDCGGDTLLIVAANGRMGWAGDDKYLLRSLTFDGTFTPSDGSPPQTESFSKTYGRGPNGPTLDCSASINETAPDGDFAATIEISVVQI